MSCVGVSHLRIATTTAETNPVYLVSTLAAFCIFLFSCPANIALRMRVSRLLPPHAWSDLFCASSIWIKYPEPRAFLLKQPRASSFANIPSSARQFRFLAPDRQTSSALRAAPAHPCDSSLDHVMRERCRPPLLEVAHKQRAPIENTFSSRDIR
jgi:hypothetical protein